MTALLTDWPMYSNDQLGCCTCSSTGHMIEAASRYGQGATIEVTDSDILAEYERVGGYVPGDPSTDNGAVAGRRNSGQYDPCGRAKRISRSCSGSR